LNKIDERRSDQAAEKHTALAHTFMGIVGENNMLRLILPYSWLVGNMLTQDISNSSEAL
jgi:hypothetical protein